MKIRVGFFLAFMSLVEVSWDFGKELSQYLKQKNAIHNCKGKHLLSLAEIRLFIWGGFLIAFVFSCPTPLHPEWPFFHYEISLENINTNINTN